MAESVQNYLPKFVQKYLPFTDSDGRIAAEEWMDFRTGAFERKVYYTIVEDRQIQDFEGANNIAVYRDATILSLALIPAHPVAGFVAGSLYSGIDLLERNFGVRKGDTVVSVVEGNYKVNVLTFRTEVYDHNGNFVVGGYPTTIGQPTFSVRY